MRIWCISEVWLSIMSFLGWRRKAWGQSSSFHVKPYLTTPTWVTWHLVAIFDNNWCLYLCHVCDSQAVFCFYNGNWWRLSRGFPNCHASKWKTHPAQVWGLFLTFHFQNEVILLLSCHVDGHDRTWDEIFCLVHCGMDGSEMPGTGDSGNGGFYPVSYVSTIEAQTSWLFVPDKNA